MLSKLSRLGALISSGTALAVGGWALGHFVTSTLSIPDATIESMISPSPLISKVLEKHGPTWAANDLFSQDGVHWFYGMEKTDVQRYARRVDLPNDKFIRSLKHSSNNFLEDSLARVSIPGNDSQTLFLTSGVDFLKPGDLYLFSYGLPGKDPRFVGIEYTGGIGTSVPLADGYNLVQTASLVAPLGTGFLGGIAEEENALFGIDGKKHTSVVAFLYDSQIFIADAESGLLLTGGGYHTEVNMHQAFSWDGLRWRREDQNSVLDGSSVLPSELVTSNGQGLPVVQLYQLGTK